MHKVKCAMCVISLNSLERERVVNVSQTKLFLNTQVMIQTNKLILSFNFLFHYYLEFKVLSEGGKIFR